MLANDSNPLRAWALATSFDEEAWRQSAMLRFLCVNDDKLPTLVAQAVEAFQYVSARDYVLLLQWSETPSRKHARFSSHMNGFLASMGPRHGLSQIFAQAAPTLFCYGIIPLRWSVGPYLAAKRDPGLFEM